MVKIKTEEDTIHVKAKKLHRVTCFGIPKEYRIVVQGTDDERLAYQECVKRVNNLAFIIFSIGTKDKVHYFIAFNIKFFLMISKRMDEAQLTHRLRIYITDENINNSKVKCDVQYINPLLDGQPYFVDVTRAQFDQFLGNFQHTP